MIEHIRKNVPKDATHTNGKTFYLYEELYEDEKGEWYRWLKTKKVWTEILSKPRSLKKIGINHD